MNRKSQAAMEFLMNYGWAIVILLAALGGLMYFQVLDVCGIHVNRCFVEDGFTCSNYKTTPEVFELSLTNNMGKDLSMVSVKFTGDISQCYQITVWPPEDCIQDLLEKSCFIPGGTQNWDIIDCSIYADGCILRTDDVVKNGENMFHVRFRSCGMTASTEPFNCKASTDFEITYQIGGENYLHKATGKASLKVE
ncbi:MAG: hypothetical protein KKG59_04010 [Nanoarchaeota archaeon]|nr:hypothetical protein [Nanoarchaeota archaeon]